MRIGIYMNTKMRRSKTRSIISILVNNFPSGKFRDVDIFQNTVVIHSNRTL